MTIKGGFDALRYRNWLGLAQKSNDGGRAPALVVSGFLSACQAYSSLADLMAGGSRVWAFGYNMDNMKAVSWCEGIMPLVIVAEEFQTDFEVLVRRVIDTAEYVAGQLSYGLRSAWFSPGDNRRTPAYVPDLFWRETEDDFYRVLPQIVNLMEKGAGPMSDEMARLKLDWLAVLRRQAVELFDRYSQSGRIDQAQTKRIAEGWNRLRRSLSDKSKKIMKLLDLDQDRIDRLRAK